MLRRTSSENIVAADRSFMPRGVSSPASCALSKITFAVSDGSLEITGVTFDGLASPARSADAENCVSRIDVGDHGDDSEARPTASGGAAWVPGRRDNQGSDRAGAPSRAAQAHGFLHDRTHGRRPADDR